MYSERFTHCGQGLAGKEKDPQGIGEKCSQCHRYQQAAGVPGLNLHPGIPWLWHILSMSTPPPGSHSAP